MSCRESQNWWQHIILAIKYSILPCFFFFKIGANEAYLQGVSTAILNRLQPVFISPVWCGFCRFFYLKRSNCNRFGSGFFGSVRSSFGLFPVHWTEPSNTNDDFDLEDEDLYMATMAEEELGIELERTPYQSSPTPSSPMEITADSLHTMTRTGKASRLWGGFEKDLENKPVIVRFGGQAGAVIKEATPSNNRYSAKIGTHQNCYTPFNSELDWKFARWAKLRGPGSTSVTELLAIEGVRMIATVYHSLFIMIIINY